MFASVLDAISAISAVSSSYLDLLPTSALSMCCRAWSSALSLPLSPLFSFSVFQCSLHPYALFLFMPEAASLTVASTIRTRV